MSSSMGAELAPARPWPALAAVLALAAVSCGGSAKKTETPKVTPLGAATSFTTIHDLGAALTKAGLACDTANDRATDYGACFLSGGGSSVLLYTWTPAKLDARLKDLRGGSATCGSNGVLRSGKYLRGADWMIVDPDGTLMPSITAEAKRDALPIC